MIATAPQPVGVPGAGVLSCMARMANDAATSKKRILIVEDDALVRHALIRQLSRDYAVESTGGADGALALMKERPFHLVLSDYAMPEQSGVALARELRGTGFMGPIILLTAVPTAADIPEALQTGLVQAIVPKPWSYRDLIALIAARLG